MICRKRKKKKCLNSMRTYLNDYVQDIVSVYGVSEDEIKTLNREYKKIRDGYQIKVKNTKEATELIVEHQDLFMDYEVVKGGMDDVFLAVTGKKLGGEC